MVSISGTAPISITCGRAAPLFAKTVPKITMKNNGNRIAKNRLNLSL